MVRFCQEMGGFLALEDLAAFRAKFEPPVSTTYRGHTVYGCGPWCQGPVVLQALNILEGYDLASLPVNSAAAIHLIVEALLAAFSDRHAYYGDPDVVDVPIVGLLSKAYAASWRDRIDEGRAWPAMPDPGDPWPHQGRAGRAPGAPAQPVIGPRSPDTSYVCVLDADGNAFSATPSDGVLETPIVPGLGFVISSRGSQSWLDQTHPSGLAPHKRPRLTPNPGLLLTADGRIMPYGTPGHDVQPQAMLQFLVNLLDYGMDVQEAIEMPRVASYSFPGSTHPHPYDPGRLAVEARVSPAVQHELVRRGHRIESWPEWTPSAGAVCAAIGEPGGMTLVGGADPRRLAYAIGW
jgi:gamma-glutamyltranspeptidase/glutathione hydrolase